MMLRIQTQKKNDLKQRMGLTETTQVEDLIERILALTHSDQSVSFYRKAIDVLGRGLVESELGELRYRIHMGEIKDPARYFTSLLQKGIAASKNNGEGSAIKGKALEVLPPSNKGGTYFSASPVELFEELRSSEVSPADLTTEKFMDVYSKNTIPWVTFIGPEFFTLSTNKVKSDTITAKIRTLDGQIIVVPMIRGKISPEDRERGVLNVEHGRILGALENLWVQQGGPYLGDGKKVVCYCDVSVRQLAELLGRKSSGKKTFGGKDLKSIKRMVMDLAACPFYLALEEVPELKLGGWEGIGFKFLGDVALGKKRPQTVLQVNFSVAYSRQLLGRRVVSRPKDILTIRSELAWLVRLYIEPILMSKSAGNDHAIELKNLIDNLNLPKAGWHQYKSHRKKEFMKAFKELNGMTTVDGRIFDLRIEQGLNTEDFMVVARLLPKETAITKI